MKQSIVFLGSVVIALLLTGCGVKPYVDVTSDEYATLQLIPKSETLIFSDDYYCIIEDYSKGCKDSVMLGLVMTDSDTPSRVVKLPVKKPLLITAKYVVTSGNSTFTDYTQFILTPEKKRDYIVEYVKTDVDFFRTTSDFHTYMKKGGKVLDIPDANIHSFSYAKDCK